MSAVDRFSPRSVSEQRESNNNNDNSRSPQFTMPKTVFNSMCCNSQRLSWARQICGNEISLGRGDSARRALVKECEESTTLIFPESRRAANPRNATDRRQKVRGCPVPTFVFITRRIYVSPFVDLEVAWWIMRCVHLTEYGRVASKCS